MSQCVTSAGKKEEKTPETDNKSRKRRHVFGRVFLCVGVLLCFLAGVLFFFDVRPKSETVFLELGDKLSHEASDYLDGFKGSLRFAHADFSKVKEDTVGAD